MPKFVVPDFDHKHYVPILKGKRAEFPAIGTVSDKDAMTPLIEAIPSALPQEVPRRMSGPGIWPAERPYFIDLLFFDDVDEEFDTADASHPLIVCFNEVQAKGQAAVPVTGTARSPLYQDAVRQIAASQGRGIALRLTTDDFDDEEELPGLINALLDLMELAPDEVDLIIDAGTVHGHANAQLRQIYRANLQLLPAIDEWRTLTIAGGAFPMGLAPLTNGAWNLAPRVDWTAWRQLVTSTALPTRLPAFGDYTIAHPNLPPAGRATILAQIRYSTPSDFLIWKGYNVHTHATGYQQIFTICANLIARPEYRGAAFSWGDAEVDARATNHGSCGNPETWRRIGVSHHIETVLDQISNLP